KKPVVEEAQAGEEQVFANLGNGLTRQAKVFRFGFELLFVGLMLVGSVEPVFDGFEHWLSSLSKRTGRRGKLFNRSGFGYKTNCPPLTCLYQVLRQVKVSASLTSDGQDYKTVLASMREIDGQGAFDTSTSARPLSSLQKTPSSFLALLAKKSDDKCE